MADDVLLQIAATGLVLRPGDVLILATERSLSMADAERVSEHFATQCPDLRVVIADGFSGMAAYRPGDVKAAEGRPEMLSDRLGYPSTVGDEDWRRINETRKSGGEDRG